MTDKELLQMAAKAAGLSPILCYEKVRNCLQIGPRNSYTRWRPLTYDRDALRLAVSLKLVIDYADTEKATWVYFGDMASISIAHKDDPYAATRRAIVRAAAEIGKAMP